MPSFLLLFRDDTARGDPSSRPDQAALYERFVTWADKLHREKRLLGVERLEDAGARTVRRRGGRLVVDGPFAEGKEAVLGYFIVEAKDEEEAARLARDCPGLDDACAVEVRRVAPFPKPS
ncbi:MAG TPA: YciI family protein [Myxococcaceae bacterium]|nr:YciI family protein [Myxococcaceae bacterium]